MDEKSEQLVGENGLVVSVDAGKPGGDSTAEVTARKFGKAILITNVEFKKPPSVPFEIAAEKTLPLIVKPDIPDPQVSVTMGDITPAIPHILYKIMFTKDWKTSLAGFAGALIVAVGDYVSSGGKMTLAGIGTALGLAAIGWFVPDKTK